VAWLEDLTSDRDPHSYDLCERHTGRLSVPNGWRLEDRRTRRELVTAGSRLLAG
jgi:hypothetical protein